MSAPGPGPTGRLAPRAPLSTVPPFEPILTDFRHRLNRRLAEFLGQKHEAVAGDGDGRELVEGVERLIDGGGKRLRPALVYYAYRACGGRDREAVMSLAMAAEMLHTYLLIHDDVMDRSDLRRGRPTAHVFFADRHRRRRWAGDSGHFGRSVALLLGDLAHGWAVELFHRVPREDRGPRLDSVFTGMCEEVVLGQYMETVLPFRDAVSEEELLEVLRLKSGRYSVERPVELGALLAGASSERLERLRGYAERVGLAFQLQDDILGTFGDSGRAGKPGGTDLVEGKLTLLLHSALRSVSPERAEELRRVQRDPDPEPEAIERARAIIRDSGALDRVRGIVEKRLEEARREVETGIEDEESRAFLVGLPGYLMGRER